MVNTEMLKGAVERSGLKQVAIAKWMGITPETITNKFKGRCEFTASEIVQLSEILHLTKDERDQIFLQSELN